VSARRLIEAFGRWRDAGMPLVLVTVVETAGSTYTKAGHRILIAADGSWQGLVSGGCLEGDMAEHAREVLASGRPQLLTYDLRGEQDELFGMGIGCNGLFRVLLQALSPQEGWAPFAAIAEAMQGESAGVVATVTESDDPAVAAGATACSAGDAPRTWGLPDAWAERLLAGCRARAARPAAEPAQETDSAGRRLRVLYAPLRPLPRLLVLGAGLDAVPLAELALRLGWRVTVADHRPAYLARGDFPAGVDLVYAAPAELPRRVRLDRCAAVVVMSHHLDTDRAWLRALAQVPAPYLGLLGPAARRERLLGELGADADALRGRLRGPVGLPIGADSPETIALAVLAEVHATLAGRVDLVAGSRAR